MSCPYLKSTCPRPKSTLNQEESMRKIQYKYVYLIYIKKIQSNSVFSQVHRFYIKVIIPLYFRIPLGFVNPDNPLPPLVQVTFWIICSRQRIALCHFCGNSMRAGTALVLLNTLSKLYDIPVGFVRTPLFEAVYCYICGRRRLVVARYWIICLVLERCIFTTICKHASGFGFC